MDFPLQTRHKLHPHTHSHFYTVTHSPFKKVFIFVPFSSGGAVMWSPWARRCGERLIKCWSAKSPPPQNLFAWIFLPKTEGERMEKGGLAGCGQAHSGGINYERNGVERLNSFFSSSEEPCEISRELSESRYDSRKPAYFIVTFKLRNQI